MDEKSNGIPVSIIHFDEDGTVEPDWWALKGLAASLLPVIQEFYTHEENIRAFEEWLQERET